MTLRIFVVAGEVSGDSLGAGAMKKIRELANDEVVFAGVGGPRMAEQGLESLFPMEEISLHGLTQVLARIPALLRRMNQTAENAAGFRPDAVLLVDVPSFNIRVSRRIRKHLPDVPIIQYVAPTVWAYAPWRAKAMKRSIDRVLTILPFEPSEFERLNGPPGTYVGHPLLQKLDVLRPSPGERTSPGAPVRRLLILPGSRRSEVRRLLRPFGETLLVLAERFDDLEAILPAAPHLLPEIEAGVAEWAVKPTIVSAEDEKFAAFRSAHAALAASGTVSLELAIAGVPAVVAYKVDPIVRMLKPFLAAPSIVLSNLVLGRNVVSEHLDGDAEAATLAPALIPLLEETDLRTAHITALNEIDERMAGLETGADENAARIVLEYARRN